MDARHGRSALTAPHPAHVAHDTALFTTLIPALRLSYHIPPPEYAGLTSPALESGKWHMRMPAVEWANDGPACASRARLEVYAPLARRAPGFSYVVNGNVTPTRPALMAYKSELFNAYQVTLDADRASSAATNHALQLAASDLEFEGTRVKSPVLGRDLNPMGRGDGAYYADGGNVMGGSVRVGTMKPVLIGESGFGYGSSVNNQGGLGGGGDTERTELMLKARDDCGVEITTCPTLETECGDPCAGINIHDPHEFCCKCVPKLCPDCSQGGCSKKVGCCFTYTSAWHERCGNPGNDGWPPVTPPNGECGCLSVSRQASAQPCGCVALSPIPLTLCERATFLPLLTSTIGISIQDNALSGSWLEPFVPFLSCILENILAGMTLPAALAACALRWGGVWTGAQTGLALYLLLFQGPCCCDDIGCFECCWSRFAFDRWMCFGGAGIGAIISKALNPYGIIICLERARTAHIGCLADCADCPGN